MTKNTTQPQSGDTPSDSPSRDDVLKRMLKMKPTPHRPVKKVKKKKAASSAAAKR